MNGRRTGGEYSDYTNSITLLLTIIVALKPMVHMEKWFRWGFGDQRWSSGAEYEGNWRGGLR